MPIYTRAGDQGKTHLLSGETVVKDAPRLEVSGTVDELSASLGVVRAESLSDDVDRLLGRVQHELSDILAELGTADPAALGTCRIGPPQIRALEEVIDCYEETLQPLTEFILPAGVRPAAGLHFARTLCRRAERRMVTLVRTDGPETSPSLAAYLNRLSDLLFVLARTVNQQAGRSEAARP